MSSTVVAPGFSRARATVVASVLCIAVLGLGAAAERAALVDAAKNTDLAALRALLEQGADVNAAEADGTTALHWASYRDDGESADVLIRAGARVNAANDLGATPLWLASQNASDRMVRRLLEAGANPNAALLLGETPVMVAARSGNPTVVEQLLARGASVNALGARGQTALMWAVAQKHPAVVEVLVAHGADVHARSDAWSLVMAVSPHGHLAYNRAIPHGNDTALLFAARVGDLLSATRLVEAGANVNDADAWGVSALVLAAHSGYGELVEFLLREGADPNSAAAGFTALHAAIMRRDERIVSALLAAGADPNTPLETWTPTRRQSRDFNFEPELVGATPFWLAARFSQPGVMRLLVQLGADPLFVHRSDRIVDGRGGQRYDHRVQATTALMAAVGMGGGGTAWVPPDRAAVEALTLDAVRLALELGVDVDAANTDGRTALDAATALKYETVVAFLVEKGARPGAQRTGAPQPTGAAAADADWPMHRHDPAGTGYSTLAQIDSTNVATLTRVWTYRLEGDAPAPPTGGRGGVNSQATPIVVGGVMYLPAAGRVVALDPDTGREVWQHAVTGGAPSRRGVAYWAGDGSLSPRIVLTIGRRLVALDAATGARAAGFGQDGEVDMVVPYNSVPLVSGNVVVVGANTPPGTGGGIGNARAFDARTGAKLWEFSSVPQPGTIGHDTWDGASWQGRLGVNAWPFYFTLDAERGLLYLPLASPIPGSYGGDRKGANLFGNSVVAVDLQTGAYRWHFQTIHHDLWDADPPAPPGLFDIVRSGRTVPALGLTTKSGYLYILNRETGEPIFGVEERPVPSSDVPGELAFPTQPFPVKPPPLARNAYTAADLVTAADTTPEHAAACAELIQQIGGVRNAGPFTPWGYRAEGATPASTLVFPGGLGGANWGGIAYDPNAGLVFVVTQDVGALGSIGPARPGSPVPYEKTTPGRSTFDVPIGGANWPCQKPPWGRLTAVTASTGDIAWQIPLGVTDQLPEGKQHTGRPALAGPIVTASGLLFIASTDDNRFRALDAKTGRQLWETRLDRRGNADPITYQGRSGRQYVAVVATDTLAVYALP